MEVGLLEERVEIAPRLLPHIHVRLRSLLYMVVLGSYFDAVVVIRRVICFLSVNVTKGVIAVSPALEQRLPLVEAPHQQLVFDTLGDEVARLAAKLDPVVSAFGDQVRDAL